MEECGPCPVFAGFTLAFGLQPRKKHGKPSLYLVKERGVNCCNKWGGKLLWTCPENGRGESAKRSYEMASTRKKKTR